MDLLQSELNMLDDIDMGDFGFDMSEYIDDVEIEEDDFNEEVPDNPVTVKGNVYKLGDHVLMCGDSTDKDDVMTLTGNNKIDMVFTDPPYGMNAVSKSGVLSKTYKDDIMNDDDNRI